MFHVHYKKDNVYSSSISFETLDEVYSFLYPFVLHPLYYSVYMVFNKCSDMTDIDMPLVSSYRFVVEEISKPLFNEKFRTKIVNRRSNGKLTFDYEDFKIDF